MKILYIDSSMGVSEEALIQAFMDLGVNETFFMKEVDKISMQKLFSVDTIMNSQDICKTVVESKLSEEVKMLGCRILERLFEAFDRLKSLIPISEFQRLLSEEKFLEYIIKASICICYLKPDMIFSSMVRAGGEVLSSVDSKKQTKAFLTAELLKGINISKADDINGFTTPIAAAIISGMTDRFTDLSSFKFDTIGYGKNISPEGREDSIVRVFIGNTVDNSIREAELEDRFEYDEKYIIECNIDDMNPEIYDYMFQKFLEAGAADVFLTPIIMKKGRPAVKLSILCSEEKCDWMAELILRETSTFGVRKIKVERSMLKRQFTKIQTEYGEVTVKNGILDGRIIKAKPEYEDCKRIAMDKKIPITRVYAEAVKKIHLDK